MANKGEISGLKSWLITLASFLDEIALLVVLFLALKLFHVNISWPIILAVVVAVVFFFIITHKLMLTSIRRRKITGAEGLIGMTGVVVEDLRTRGRVKIKSESWEAISLDGDIEAGAEIEVVKLTGLVLQVKRKLN
jgi:membrane-bound serine protease (ClpP class)